MSAFTVVLWSINAVTVIASAAAVRYSIQAARSSRRTRQLLR